MTFYAETDHDALGFYIACGFEARSLGEKYPGVERFKCVLPAETSAQGLSLSRVD